MLTYDPASSLRHYPIPMRKFGLNQYGDALYRIVFAPTRRYLVCGTWPDGSNKAVYSRKYPEVGEQWIMERWLPAAEYAKCTKDFWDRELLILGPWPERGEYEVCHVFETSTPDDASLEKLIAMIEEGRNRSYFEKRTFHREDAEREAKSISNQQDAMIRNWLPAFGAAPMVGFGGGRGSKTMPILKSAEEMGLPTQGGQFRTKHRPDRQKFEVPLEA